MTASNLTPVFSLHQGSLPLLISIPHLGTKIPADIAATMTPVAQRTDDCDWHLDRLYAFAKRLGASILTPTYARYVVDLNRPPDGANLYLGRTPRVCCRSIRSRRSRSIAMAICPTTPKSRAVVTLTGSRITTRSRASSRR
jgi:N-formylglutamate amidohydrolase